MIGTAGSGKTTFVRALAAKLDVQHIELDGLFSQPGWLRAHRRFRRSREQLLAGYQYVRLRSTPEVERYLA